jgi:hypothetical protein
MATVHTDYKGQPFEVGDDVIWMCVPRGGWGIPHPVPARIVKLNPKTIRIAGKLKRGGEEEVNVKAENLRRPKKDL